MAKKETQEQQEPELEVKEETQQTPPEETAQAAEPVPEKDPWEEKYNQERDAHLRVAAEFDNFRKRTIKEKDAAYGNGKSDTLLKILPIYDMLNHFNNLVKHWASAMLTCRSLFLETLHDFIAILFNNTFSSVHLVIK